jgi:uncharacterized flavoprotein (TIGR03862 family)
MWHPRSLLAKKERTRRNQNGAPAEVDCPFQPGRSGIIATMASNRLNTQDNIDIGIIGAGPAGLMAAEVLATAGHQVTVFDASASAGRKFLLAGKGGLNLSHSEPIEQFSRRYHGGGEGSQTAVDSWLKGFGPADVRQWCHGLGVETFVGSSGRVFPVSLKAAPLLRAWLHRLRGQGVRFAMKHRWSGWDDAGQPHFLHQGEWLRIGRPPRAWILALGGGSWPHLGSDAAWIPWLRERGVAVADLQASNSGFDVAVQQADGTARPGWSAHLLARFAGAAIKNLAVSVREANWTQRGELLLSATGIEGNLAYAAGSRLRQRLAAADPAAPSATLWLNLLPDFPAEKVRSEVARARGPRSWSTHLKSRLGLDGVKMALLREILPESTWNDATALGQAIVALPLTVTAPRPIAEAISTSGGISFSALTPQLELLDLPGFFCAGEMLDWDAPTGGYLLTACLASGRLAGQSVAKRLAPTATD